MGAGMNYIMARVMLNSFHGACPAPHRSTLMLLAFGHDSYRP